ncbi:TPA: hypothetical protein J1363_004637 [Escherichia coli]|nr:hypothetical protein [Escherichia coli]HBA9372945.1 hypothetical protein [Escherichia coli]
MSSVPHAILQLAQSTAAVQPFSGGLTSLCQITLSWCLMVEMGWSSGGRIKKMPPGRSQETGSNNMQ